MEIKRIFEDGTELRIPLTDEEIERAYRERRRYYNKCDLIHRIGTYMDLDDYSEDLPCDDDDEVEIGSRTMTGKQIHALIADEKWMDSLISDFEDALDNNDSYWESFWCTAENVIEDAIAEVVPVTEKDERREKNRAKYRDAINEVVRMPISVEKRSEIVDMILNIKEEDIR